MGSAPYRNAALAHKHPQFLTGSITEAGYTRVKSQVRSVLLCCDTASARRHPEFLAGNITTSFIEKHSSQLFNFEGHQSESSSKLLLYLANMSTLPTWRVRTCTDPMCVCGGGEGVPRALIHGVWCIQGALNEGNSDNGVGAQGALIEGVGAQATLTMVWVHRAH
eukprot:1160599-Pelagomonas_calceolata.AAC.20